jgi:regulator of replication initiation timing
MSYDINALIQQVNEATRSIEMATTHIHELNARLHDLQIENQRLRDRLIAAQDRIRRMEEGEL